MTDAQGDAPANGEGVPVAARYDPAEADPRASVAAAQAAAEAAPVAPVPDQTVTVSSEPAEAVPVADQAVTVSSGSVEAASVAPVPDQTVTVSSDPAKAAPNAPVADQTVTASPDPAKAASPAPVADQPALVPPASATPPLREPDEAALRLAEAAVFASVTPMTARALSQILPDDMDAAAVIAALRPRYEGRGIELVEVGGGLQFRTAADLAPQLRKVVQVPRRLPRVALETLAIVAYHQPITRPEIEDLRGTGLSQQTLDVLLENDLIVARGRKETPGRPTLWGTTPKFLEYFGLRDIRELPRRQDLLLEAVRPEGDAEAVAAAGATDGEPDRAGAASA
jgi:segregation and condensation protein B